MAEPATSEAGAPPVIELKNVSKTFGEVRSLADVNFQVNRREIVGLLGDNGAGKSTLIKIVMGFYKPDAGGEIYFHGRRVDDWSVAKARSLGIETVYQELVIDQQPYLQGYLPILNICLTKKYGFSGLDINTAGAFVDPKNVDAVAPLAAKEIR